MKVLLIHQAFASLNEAGGTRHYEMALNLRQHGHHVTIITSPISYLTGSTTSHRTRWIEKETDPAGITILRTYTYPALHRSFFHRIVSFFSFMASSFAAGIGEKNVDLVWGTSPPIFQGFTAWLLARLKNVPYLFEVRDLWPEFAIAVGVLNNRLLINASLWLEKFLYTHADQVIVNSPGFIDHVTSRGAKNVVLVPNGVDPAMFTGTAQGGEEFKQNCDIDAGFIAIYAGAHGLSNDLGIILEAAKYLLDKPEIKIVLIGDGKDKNNLISRAKEEGLHNIVFLAPVSKKEMASVLASANACIAILKPLEMYKTTYPNKVFDYMASSRAVILAIDGVIRKVVEDAGCGIFVSPGNSLEMAKSIQYLAEHPDECRQMGANGRKFVAMHFKREIFSNEFRSLIEEMVLKNGRKNTYH